MSLADVSHPALTDADIERMQALLDSVPAPLEPLDVMALDGYLCGVILQPGAIAAERWLPVLCDVDGRAPPAGFDTSELHALALRRHAELRDAIARRDWFDPWIFALDDAASPSEIVLPWVAGFAAAQDHYPALLRLEQTELVEPLALLYLHFDAEDLEDAEALQAVIDTIEPPVDLAEAVQDIVRAVMLIADVSTPRPALRPSQAPQRRAGKPGGARHGGHRPRR